MKHFGAKRKWFLLAAAFCCSATGASADALIDAGEAGGYPGWVISLPVQLAPGTTPPSSVSLALFFPDPRNVRVAERSDGTPDCTTASGVSVPGTFVFWPVGCAVDEDECDAVRALFVDLSGSRPTLPAGELFRCNVRIAPDAPPGTYVVQVRQADAGARGGIVVGVTGQDGAVEVWPPPGGGGCAIGGHETGHCAWIAGFLLALCAYRRKVHRHGLKHASVFFALLTAAAGWSGARNAALGQTVPFVAEGTWSAAQKEGTWRATLGIDANGAISGNVSFEGLGQGRQANLLAVWSRGAIRQGSLFEPGTIRRLGGVRGAITVAEVIGQASTGEDGLIEWKLRSVRPLREKEDAPLARGLLARGQVAVVSVVLDDYPAVRKARSLVQDLARYEWDTAAAEAAYEAAVLDLQDSLLRQLSPSEAALLTRPRGMAYLRLALRNTAALDKLLARPEVRAVHDPKLYAPTLAQSLPLIRQPEALARGFDGAGRTVAIVDTQIDHLLQDASGRLAFGTGCRNGPGATGCAIAYLYDAARGGPGERESPYHGTLNAGIAWSVAPASRVVGVDVFKRFPQGVGALDVDIIRGLEWVRDHWRDYDIAAVNLSLGGGSSGRLS